MGAEKVRCSCARASILFVPHCPAARHPLCTDGGAGQAVSVPLLGGHLGKDGLAAAKELPALGSVRVVQPGLLLQNLGLDLRTHASLASWVLPWVRVQSHRAPGGPHRAYLERVQTLLHRPRVGLWCGLVQHPFLHQTVPVSLQVGLLLDLEISALPCQGRITYGTATLESRSRSIHRVMSLLIIPLLPLLQRHNCPKSCGPSAPGSEQARAGCHLRRRVQALQRLPVAPRLQEKVPEIIFDGNFASLTERSFSSEVPGWCKYRNRDGFRSWCQKDFGTALGRSGRVHRELRWHRSSKPLGYQITNSYAYLHLLA